MTICTDRIDDWTGADEPAVRVESTDAAGNQRVYRVRLSTDTLDGKRILGGRRIDGGAPDEPAGGGPSEEAYAAARRAFEERGFAVHGGADDE